MSKPQWLIDQENKPEREHTYCHECKFFEGKYLGTTKHKGKETVDVWACKRNPATLNTKYSICCENFVRQ